MKKHICATLCLWVMVALLGCVSCTHNNGDIGPLYGQWKLVSIDAGNGELHEYAGDVFWDFQDSAVQILLPTDIHEFEQRYGNWVLTDEDTRLVLTFPDPRWPAPASIGLQPTTVLRVVTLTGRNAVFELAGSDGEPSITYTLRKW